VVAGRHRPDQILKNLKGNTVGNHWVNLVTLLAVLEFFAFGFLVGRARAKYGIKAPATFGHEMFDRYFRVHYNTLELMIMFVPALWIAAMYWNPLWMAAIGAVYLVGRILYLYGYVAEPKQRSTGFGLSIVPIAILVLAALAGAGKGLLGF
jgi:glutathione S-transferase